MASLMARAVPLHTRPLGMSTPGPQPSWPAPTVNQTSVLALPPELQETAPQPVLPEQSGTGSRPGSQDPQEAQVVLERRNPGLGAGRDHLLDVFDVAIALRTFPQHDRAAALVVDMA